MTLREKIKSQGLELTNTIGVRNFLMGRTVEITGSSDGNIHSYAIGRRFKLTNNLQYSQTMHDPNMSSINDTGSGMGNFVFLHNLKLIGASTIADFNEELKELEIEEEIIKERRKNIREITKFMQENEVGNFDEDVYAVFKTIKKCKTSKSDIEKATEIAKLLKQK